MEDKIKDENYLSVQYWMCKRLDLSGNDLLVFALIHGFCQDRRSMFRGTLGYIQKMINASRTTAVNALIRLEKKGFIIKHSTQINNLTLNQYSIDWDNVDKIKCVPPVQNRDGVVQNRDGVVQNRDGGGTESVPNNNIVNILNDNLINNIGNVGQNPTPSSPKENSDSLKSSEKKEKKGAAQKKEKYRDEIIEVVEYLNDATGRNFDPEANHSKHIRGRLRDGATVDEMKEVVDMKAREWIDDEKMREYLRPQTLFNKTKYEEYREAFTRNIGKKSKALKRLSDLVDDFAADNGLIISWTSDEYSALESIASRLKNLMLQKGDEITMDNLEVVLNQVLMKLDDYQRNHFSMILINRNLNSILNADKRNSKSEWKSIVASFD